MEATAVPILELGAVFLAAAVFGFFARRFGLPAVIGYLMVGLVAFQLLPEDSKPDEEQVRLLADVGVVLLLFEVGIELDVGRLRREHRSLLAASPLQILTTTIVAGVVLTFLGQPLEVALVLGLCVAMSSSVVVVNITRSVSRRTNKATEMSLLGWSLLQDLTGVILGAFLLAVWNAEERDPLEALIGPGPVLPHRHRGGTPVPRGAGTAARLPRPLPARVHRQRPHRCRHRGRRLRHPPGAGGVRGRPRHRRQSHGQRGATPPASVP